MRTRIPLILSFFLAHSIPLSADILGVNVGASTWAPSISGGFSSSAPASSQISLGDDINLNESSNNSLAFTLEHPIPVLPNVRYQGVTVDNQGSDQLNQNLNFNGATFNNGERVLSEFDVSQEDIVLYYEVMDNWINLDLGLDIKRLDGRVALSSNSTSTTTTLNVEETLPLLYLSARFDLPFSGFYVGADLINDPVVINLSDSSAQDRTLKLGYESGNGLGIEGGLKNLNLDLDNADSLNTNLQFEGLFLNGYFHF